MPFAIDVSTEEQIARVTGIGDLTVQSSAEAMADLASRPEFQRHYGVLLDFSQITNAIHRSQMRNIADTLHNFKNAYRGRIAIVINPAEVRKVSTICMLVRVFGVQMEAYADIEPAMKYLTTGQSWY
jgi:hypothetical protein